MKRTMRIVIALGAAAGLTLWVVQLRNGFHTPPWLGSHIRELQTLYGAHPEAFVLAFCFAHFLCAMLSVPGSCTTLNIGSGAVFGFWRGCCIVYPLTVLSGCTGYFAAARIRESGLLRRYQGSLDVMRLALDEDGFLALISLRLSPILPYGILNPGLGLLRVPFGAFLASTIVGIFLDVVLLNSVGAALAAAETTGTSNAGKLFFGFIALAAAALAIRFVAARSMRGEGK